MSNGVKKDQQMEEKGHPEWWGSDGALAKLPVSLCIRNVPMDDNWKDVQK